MSSPILEAAPRPALLTSHQLCGIFNKDRQAVMKLPIPKVVLAPGDYRWDPADVEAFITARKEVVK